MMMFLLGVLITWLVLGAIHSICDYLDKLALGEIIIGLPFYLVDSVIVFIADSIRIIKVLDLCIIYRIPVFKRMSFTTLKEKLDDKGKEKWVQRMPKDQQERWRKALDN